MTKKFEIEIQPVFATNVTATYGESGKLWLRNLSQHVQDLADRWDFHLIHVIPNLSYGFVALVHSNENGKNAILKTAPKLPNTHGVIGEAKWLKSFKRGVPEIYHMDEERNAFLMENLEPGNTLKTLVEHGQDETATRIICQTILDLQSGLDIGSSLDLRSGLDLKTDLPNFPHMSSHIPSLEYLNGHMDREIISKGKSLFETLCADHSEDILLHGDLHHDNILQSGSTWKTIDPHGYVGNKVAEVGTMIRNPFDCFPKNKTLKKVLETRLQILIEMLPFDPEKIKYWVFCITLLSAAWDVEGFNKITENTGEVALELNRFVS